MAIRYLSGINVDSNTLFVDSDNNRVGIGTTSPDAKLVVVGSGTGVAKIGDAGFGSGNYTGISLNGTLSTSNYNDGAGVIPWDEQPEATQPAKLKPY